MTGPCNCRLHAVIAPSVKTRPSRSTIAVLAAVAQLAIPAVAGGTTDYSQNRPTDAYGYGPLPPLTAPAKDYDKNAATGDYAPAKDQSDQPAALGDDSGFAWQDAAIGAVAMLAFVLALVGGALVVRPRVAGQFLTRLTRPPESRVGPAEVIRVRR